MASPYYSSKIYPAKDSYKVIFFFAGFGTKVWLYRLIYKRLNTLGYTVVAYQFPARVMLKSDGYFLDNVRGAILKDMRRLIDDFKSQDYNAFSLFGVSMGSVYSIAFAKELPEISKLVLVTMYGSAGQFIWEYHRLKRMKKTYTDKNISMRELEVMYPKIEPLIDTERLNNKDILLFVSREDNVIFYKNTKRFILKAKRIGVNLNVIEGRGRHIPFIIRTLLKDKNWANFLAG